MKVTPRGRSPSHSPKAHAIWTLSALRSEIDHFLTEVFPQTPHEGIRGFPGQLFAKSVADQGNRPRRYIPYDDAFRVVTMPLFHRQVTVRHNRGIRINYFWYWHDDFIAAQWRGTKVTVRYDPQDAGVVEALLGTQWVRCKCDLALIIGYPWRDIESLTQECLAESRLTNRRKRLAPIELERYIARVRAKEFELTRHKNERQSGAGTSVNEAALKASTQTSGTKIKPRKFADGDFLSKPIVRIGGDHA